MRYARHPLGIDEVRQHIKHDKLRIRLAMTREDRVSFVLAEGCQIKDFALRDAAMDGNSQDDGGEHCHGRAFTPDSRSDGCTGARSSPQPISLRAT